MLRILSALVCTSLAVLWLFSCQSTALSSGKGRAFTVYPIEKIRPVEVPTGGTHITVRAAGNEYESVLFGITNDSNREMSISSVLILAELPQVSFELFSVQYYHVAERSRWFDPANQVGDWPDPLIPIGRTSTSRLSFDFTSPMVIPVGQNRHFLLDFHLPAGYRTAQTFRILLTMADAQPFEYAISLEPYPFDLPAQPAIATSANLNSEAILQQHAVSADSPEGRQLILDYRHLMATHYLSPYFAAEGRIPVIYPPDGPPLFDFSGFDATAGPFLDGQLFPDAPKPSSFWVPDADFRELQFDEDVEYYRQLEAHLKRRGWLARSLHFLRDEPLIQETTIIRLEAAKFKSGAPNIPTMVTRGYTDRLAQAVDIFCPDIFNLGDALAWYPLFFRNNYPIADWHTNTNPEVYRKQQNLGRVNWLYSCNSAQLLDLPNVFIDSSAAHTRVISWLMFRYGFQGFLYWHVNFNFIDGGKPWLNQFNTHAHGDGNLFYPGSKGMFWLTTNQPIASIRLKLLREGFEDFEYLRLFQQKRGAQAAYKFVAKAAKTSLSWEHDASQIGRLRDDLARQIMQP